MIAGLKKRYSIPNSSVARQFGISYTTLMRWKRRLSSGRSAVAKPGPKKVKPLDLSQLKLVAIIRSQTGNTALVQDASGKGYVINKGIYMGIHEGIVKEIQSDRVIVEEMIQNILGEEERKQREMILQKPAGEI